MRNLACHRPWIIWLLDLFWYIIHSGKKKIINFDRITIISEGWNRSDILYYIYVHERKNNKIIAFYVKGILHIFSNRGR